MRIRQTQPRHPRHRRTAQGESRRTGRGGAAMSGDGQHLEARKKASECRDFPQPWSDYLWSVPATRRRSSGALRLFAYLGRKYPTQKALFSYSPNNPTEKPHPREQQ